MARYVRIVMIVMLAAFAAGTVIHAGNAATMSKNMTLAVISGADMGDCQGCPDGDDDMLACDNACVSPILAVVPFSQADLPEVDTTTARPGLDCLTGRTGPPEPYPPRTTSLS